MLQVYREKRFFLVAIIIYMIAVVAFSANEYHYSKRTKLADIDQNLYRAAILADNLLLQEMRGNIAGNNILTFDEDYLLALKLQKLSEDLSVDYIYSLKKQDENIVFLSSSMTPEEVANTSYEPVSQTYYDEAPVAIFTAISRGEPQFFQYKDRWGHFRSLFVPFLDQNQNIYVVGVDVNIEQLQIIALHSFVKALIYGLFLGILVFPMIVLYNRLFKRYYNYKVRLAESHPITGLPNKRSLVRKIESALSVEQHLLLIRIENLHDISNLNGVRFGDELLLKIKYCLLEMTVSGIEHCEFYHVDESLFGVYTQYNLTRQQQRDIVSRVFNDLTKMSIKSEDDKTISINLRMATASNEADVYTLARMTLKYAADHNKDIVAYHPDLELPVYFQRHLDIHHAINESINNQLIKVFYQPIVDATTGHSVKYEALIRLQGYSSPRVISTEAFMAVAYHSRLCHKLTRIVVDDVIASVKKHRKTVSINLSVKDLFDLPTREYLIQQVRKNKVGQYIEFELLEQQSINDYPLAAAYIRQLKSCVAAIGMDDLGKLYSNFDRLLELPIDFIKIDGVLIESLVSDEEHQSIVSGIVKFAEGKKMKVIAEFCSSREVCEKVVDMNIKYMQGFYLSEPMASIAEVDTTVAKSEWFLSKSFNTEKTA